MNKKIKKSFIALLLFLGVFGVTAFANPLKHAGFMGEVVKVQKCENTKEMKLLVCGYLKGCEITKTQMVVICNKDTEVKDSCNKKGKDLEIKEGDTVCIELDSKMTKSIPPQATAKKIYVSKSEGKCKREEKIEEKVEDKNSAKVDEKDSKKEEKKVEAPKADEKIEEKAEMQ
ncbi:MAG: hypothetical protein ACRDDY_01655 [Clostridium sp.]|uniref:hypothetical protein n=1 Tax=Clostridium sp. TaxID=1506 RepID=UPI003EE7D0F6